MTRTGPCLAILLAGTSVLALPVAASETQTGRSTEASIPTPAVVAALPRAEERALETRTAPAGLAARIEASVMGGRFESDLPDLSDGAAQAARMAYAQGLFRPIWTEVGAEALIDLARRMPEVGLAADAGFAGSVERIVERRFSDGDGDRRASADLDLTSVWLRLAAAVSGGLADEGRAATRSEDRPARSTLTVALHRAGKGDPAGALAPFEPPHPQYAGLKDALRTYRGIEAEGGWPVIPAGPLLHEGDGGPRVTALRARLQAEGYVVAADVEPPMPGVGPAALVTEPSPFGIAMVGTALADPRAFRAPLAEAVKAFQRRHGLDADGVVGPATLRALNETVASKVDRIARNLDRWRRQGDMGRRFVWANIPSFSAEGWNAGRREIRMKTIVGKPSRETPVFSDRIEYTVANPKWYVPVSIARRDKRPKLIEDSTYADRKGFSVYERSTGLRVEAASVNWKDPTSVTRYRMVQAPGPENALGALKIIFPNRHSVYLHGTPSVSLFNQSSRAFSSGCIRLERPVAMAAWLASHDTRASAPKIREAIDSGENRHIPLGVPVPVHLTYMTVTVQGGVPFFWRDIYERDGGRRDIDMDLPDRRQQELRVALDTAGAVPDH